MGTPKKEQVTHVQLQTYVQFCRDHPEIIVRKKKRNHREPWALWKQLANKLNACNGPNLSELQWRERLYMWKSNLRAREKRLKINNQSTSGDKRLLKALTNFEKNALEIFELSAVDVDDCESNAGIDLMYSKEGELINIEHKVSPLPSRSSSPLPSLNSEPSISSLRPENQYDTNCHDNTEPSEPPQISRKELINASIPNIAKWNAADDQRPRNVDKHRQQHREVMQAIQGLTNAMTDFINILKQQNYTEEK